MSELSLDQVFHQALTHHLNGRLKEAETLYRAILQVQPDHPDASRNLHVLLSEQIVARQQEAESLYRSIQESMLGQPDTAQSSSAPILQSDQEAQSDTLPKPEQPPTRPLEVATNASQTSPAPVSQAEDNHQKASRKKKKKGRSVRSQGSATQAQRRALIALYEAGRIDDCEKSARQLTRTYPKDGFCWKVYGTVLAQNGKTEQALPSLERALALTPRDADTHNSLGVVYDSLQRLEDALTHYRQALELAPNNAQIHNNLGTTLKALGRLSESEASYHRALKLQPNYAEAHSNLGNVLRDLGRPEEAEVSLRQALALDPNFARAHRNLGALLLDMGRVSEAEGCCRRALELEPNAAQGHSHLGSALKELGRLDEALDCYSQALTIKPDHATAFDNLLFTLNYHPDKSPEEIFSAYQEYDRRFGLPHRAAWRTHTNDRSLSRRLRIGYVSPDFYCHSTRHALEPLLKHHDHRAFEVFAYAELTHQDEVTARYKQYVDHWIPTRGLTYATLAERIRADGIDILIDLAGHTAGNRLEVFTLKPAPVSVSWLGYGYTTGLSAIDYFLTDEIVAPPGSEKLFSEEPWRLTQTLALYRPPPEMGEVSPLPAISKGFVTFGTLSRPIRFNHRTVRTWAKILQALPTAHLILDSKDLADTQARATWAACFAEYGIAEERLEMGYHSPPWDRLRDMDIGLDCFPHNSGVTLYEHLYLGVPFVTLAGRPSVGRIGAALLHGVGHPEWIASSEDEYVDIALALARDLKQLAGSRQGLRREMLASPLVDEVGFTRQVEQAYRNMWRKWCENNQTPENDALDRHPLQIATPPQPLTRKRLAQESGSIVSRPFVRSAEQPSSATFTSLDSSTSSETVPPINPQTLIRLFEEKRFSECEAAAREMTQCDPSNVFAWKVYGGVLAQLKQNASALPALQKALSLDHRDPEIHNALGVVLRNLHRHDEAIETLRQALSLRADYAEAHNNLGTALCESSREPEAEASFRQALAINPNYAQAHSNLGNVLKALGRLEEAEASYREALALQPNYAEALSNLSAALKDQGRLHEAEAICRKALELQPNLAEAHNNLATVFKESGRLAEAENSCRKALSLQPDLPDPHCNLGNVLKDLGHFDDAVACYTRALQIDPASKLAIGNLLFTLNYHPDKTAEEIFEAYQAFDRQFGKPHHTAWRPHTNERDPNRRLHIGYVSPDFRQHSIRHALEPLLEHHDKRNFKITAYANVKREDAYTARYKGYVDNWVSTISLSDEALIERIRTDQIDILVDLAGHTDSSRLEVFAYKPAPISVTWLGYMCTTGLSAIDYFLANSILAPPGAEHLFSENLWRLPGSYPLIYRPADNMGTVSSLPALSNGYVTFGTLTRAVRINHRTIRTWAEILQRVPTARLMVDSLTYRDYRARETLVSAFINHGISSDRLLLGYHSPPWDQLRAMDIGLDCFPHNSGITLYEHLYLGTPIITLMDRPPLGRIGATILHGVGHPEWIAETEADYVEIAVALANDLPALADYRECLRDEMLSSPLMKEREAILQIEQAYREMWKRWCDS